MGVQSKILAINLRVTWHEQMFSRYLRMIGKAGLFIQFWNVAEEMVYSGDVPIWPVFKVT